MSLSNYFYNLSNHPVIKFDSSKQKYYISHKFYTNYYNTKNEVMEYLTITSMIELPKSFSLKIQNLIKKKQD